MQIFNFGPTSPNTWVLTGFYRIHFLTVYLFQQLFRIQRRFWIKEFSLSDCEVNDMMLMTNSLLWVRLNNQVSSRHKGLWLVNITCNSCAIKQMFPLLKRRSCAEAHGVELRPLSPGVSAGAVTFQRMFPFRMTPGWMKPVQCVCMWPFTPY